MPLTPAFGSLRKENHEFDCSLYLQSDFQDSQGATQRSPVSYFFVELDLYPLSDFVTPLKPPQATGILENFLTFLYPLGSLLK